MRFTKFNTAYQIWIIPLASDRQMNVTRIALTIFNYSTFIAPFFRDNWPLMFEIFFFTIMHN